MNREWNKVFIIGIQRTGTSYIKNLLKSQELKILDFNKYGIFDLAIKDKLSINKFIVDHSKADGAKDAPWFLIYEYLDKSYPNSKFILTTRKDSDTWFRSFDYHTMRGNKRHRWHVLVNNLHIYKRPIPHTNEEYFKLFYENHNNNVREYFKDRPNDLLDVCVSDKNLISNLSDFLDINIPLDVEVKNSPVNYDKYEELCKKAEENYIQFYWSIPLIKTRHGLK